MTETKGGVVTLHVHPSALTNNLTATMDVLYLLARESNFDVLELDLYYVPRLDSRAIKCLVHLKDMLESRHAELRLVNVPIPIVHLFENLHLDEYFHSSAAYNLEEPVPSC